MTENTKCPICASLDTALYFGQDSNENRKMICCTCFYIFETEAK